jgi:hypothetical protein
MKVSDMTHEQLAAHVETLTATVETLAETNRNLWRLVHKRSETIMPDGAGRIIPQGQSRQNDRG